MKIKKRLLIGLVFFGLGLSVSSNVEADKYTPKPFVFKTNKVRLTKNVYANRNRIKFPLMTSYVDKRVLLHKGTVLKTNYYGVNWMWMLGRNSRFKSTNKHVWDIKKEPTDLSWFKVIHTYKH